MTTEAPPQAIMTEAPKEAPKERKNSNVKNINDLEKEGVELKIDPNTQKTGWKLNVSPSTVEDPTVLKAYLTTPPVKKIDLHFPLGIDLTVRNMKGVTIKDALDTMYKTYKKRADDELPEPYLLGFEWDKEESWTRLKVHLSKNPTVPVQAGKKGKKK